MTEKETMDAGRQSHLWRSLPLRDRIEAISHALETVGSKVDMREDARDISDLIGEIYSG
jgi:hypothetical protein